MSKADEYLKHSEERIAQLKSFGYDVHKERQIVLDAAGIFEGEILEAGTGGGQMTCALAAAGHRVLSIDTDEEALAYAKSVVAQQGYSHLVSLAVGDIARTAYADSSFDVIISVHVLHHFEDAFAVMDEMMRLIAPTGKIVLSEFTAAGYAVVDKVHALKGRTHQVADVTLGQAVEYLEKRGFVLERKSDTYQEVVIASQCKSEEMK